MQRGTRRAEKKISYDRRTFQRLNEMCRTMKLKNLEFESLQQKTRYAIMKEYEDTQPSTSMNLTTKLSCLRINIEDIESVRKVKQSDVRTAQAKFAVVNVKQKVEFQNLLDMMQRINELRIAINSTRNDVDMIRKSVQSLGRELSLRRRYMIKEYVLMGRCEITYTDRSALPHYARTIKGQCRCSNLYWTINNFHAPSSDVITSDASHFGDVSMSLSLCTAYSLVHSFLRHYSTIFDVPLRHIIMRLTSTSMIEQMRRRQTLSLEPAQPWKMNVTQRQKFEYTVYLLNCALLQACSANGIRGVSTAADTLLNLKMLVDQLTHSPNTN